MKNKPDITSIIAISSITIVIIAFVIYASRSARTKQGLVHYFARLGIEVDYTAIVIALGLIPVFWIIALIIKTWSAK
ncbi:MAG TPA: hypothetical protein VMU10_01625 [Desulfomonilia bacterium]|nr:hypothetical protein [Desulfomonilia bacterium]